MMVNPAAASSTPTKLNVAHVADNAVLSTFGSITLSNAREMLDTARQEEKIKKKVMVGNLVMQRMMNLLILILHRMSMTVMKVATMVMSMLLLAMISVTKNVMYTSMIQTNWKGKKV
jgi:hypothetical protein